MGIKRSMRHFNFAHQGPLYPWPSTTEPLFSTSWNHNFHNTNYKLSVRHVLGLQECFWLFLISEYFSKIAMRLDYQTISGHDIIRKNTKKRNDREDTVTMDLWMGKCTHRSYRQKKLNRSGRSRVILITSSVNIWPVCVCVFVQCIGSLIKPPNHVCVSNTEILSSIARIVSCTWC